MRTDGKIDVPIENGLAIDRLISLFYNNNGDRNVLFTEINEKNGVDSLSISLNKETVEEKWGKTKQRWKKNNGEDEFSFENLKKYNNHFMGRSI